MNKEKVPGQLINLFQIEIERQLQELIDIQLKIETNKKILDEVRKEYVNQSNSTTEAIEQIKKINNMLEKPRVSNESPVWEVEDSEEKTTFTEVEDDKTLDEESLMNLLEEQQKLYEAENEYDE